MLQALCKRAAGNRAAALDRLGQALSGHLARVPTVFSTRVRRGRAARNCAMWRLLSSSSSCKLFPHEAAPVPESGRASQQTQFEILRLLDFGLTNQEIADGWGFPSAPSSGICTRSSAN